MVSMKVKKKKDMLTSVLSANTAGFAFFISFHDLPYLQNNTTNDNAINIYSEPSSGF